MSQDIDDIKDLEGTPDTDSSFEQKSTQAQKASKVRQVEGTRTSSEIVKIVFGKRTYKIDPYRPDEKGISQGKS